MNLIGQVINGMKIVGEPIRSGVRGSNYRYPCECEICGNRKDLTLQSLRARKTIGCGCLVDGLITKNGMSFLKWCTNNKKDRLLDLWDYEKNNVSPDNISSYSQKSYWFKCEHNRHDSFLYPIVNITRRQNHGCFCKKCNSFAQHFIDRFGIDEFNAILDYDNNTIDPWDLSYGSKQEIVVKCMNNDDHKSYTTNAKNLMRGRRCPECAKYNKTSKLQMIVEKYIRSNYNFDIVREFDCSLVCINPNTGYQLPYDNEVTVYNTHLIIEVHGEQHYLLNEWHKLIANKQNTTPEQVLKDQQWRDEYKKQYAILQGYYYIAIPYWTEKDESYKILIDNKIQEILQLILTQQNNYTVDDG